MCPEDHRDLENMTDSLTQNELVVVVVVVKVVFYFELELLKEKEKNNK